MEEADVASRFLDNLIAQVPLDIRDKDTGQRDYRSGYINKHCSVRALKKDNKVVELQLYLRGAPRSTRKDRKYKVTNGTVSDRFWESVREHSQSKMLSENEAIIEKATVKKAYEEQYKPFRKALCEEFDLTPDEYAVRRLQDGVETSVRFRPKDYSFTITVGFDPQRNLVIEEMQIGPRYLTADQVKDILRITGTERAKLKEAPTMSRNGELFNGI